MSKTFLIVERSDNKLHLKPGEEKYVLEGIFTEVGVKNNNNRIYDEKELIPHVNELKKLCDSNKLLGELDHPKSFDISLQNASHIIESIDYDKDKKQVIGRIRLLNTDAGKNARALVDAGVPLHISSRAAGVVENNGHVKIKKMFTYDLVANPGFSNAELKRVNENFGFDDYENIGIYEVPNTWNLNLSPETNTTNENENKEKMETGKYISVEDFNQYSRLIKNEFEKLKTQIVESNKTNESTLDSDIVNYAESIAEQVNQMQEKINSLTENVEGLISHNDYIIENLENLKNYAEMIAEVSDSGINYSEKLAESVDHLIEYTRMIAEKTDQSISYAEMIAEKTDQSISYAEMIAEKTDQSISYAEMIAEENTNRWNYQTTINETLDNVISHNDYIVETVDSVIKYSDYLKENTENITGYIDFVVEKLNEGWSSEDIKKSLIKSSTDIVEKAKSDKSTIFEEKEKEDTYQKEITKQLNAILESAKNEAESSLNKKYHFFNFLSESKRNEFDSFNKETQDKIVSAFESNRYYGSVDANKIWESCFTNKMVKRNWLTDMPSKYLTAWNSLTEVQKNSIKAQASTRVLESQYQIDNFWETRDLRPIKADLITESMTAPISESSEYKTPDSYMDAVREGFRKRFKK